MKQFATKKKNGPKAFLLPAAQFLIVSAFIFFYVVPSHAGLDAPHNSTNGISCENCHHVTSNLSQMMPAMTYTPQDIDDTPFNALCWSCHNDTTATREDTHSSIQTDNDYGPWTVECRVCHNQHIQDQAKKYNSTYGKLIRTEIDLSKIGGGVTDINGDPVPLTGKKQVKFLGVVGPNSFADGDISYDGICEVCHTEPHHYLNDGTGSDQTHVNIDQFGTANSALDTQECIFCHSHKDGFRPSCTDCHGLPPVLSTTGGPDGLVGPGSKVPASGKSYGISAATGSVTNGQHVLHATRSGYNFPCSTCHSGGMQATMTASDVKVDHNIQIGFSGAAILNMSDGQDTSYNGQSALTGYSYQGTNSTTVSSGGAMTCVNTYCHSDGTTVATGYDVPKVPVNTSPNWDGSTACNSCHGYGPDDPDDSHIRHLSLYYAGGLNEDANPCHVCHYNTTRNGITIFNRANHVNGRYDVVRDPNSIFKQNMQPGNWYPVDFVYTFDPNGSSCANISCHTNLISLNKTWAGPTPPPPPPAWYPEAEIVSGRTVKVSVPGSAYAKIYVYWGNGTNSSFTSGDFAQYTYPSSSTYEIRVLVYDPGHNTYEYKWNIWPATQDCSSCPTLQIIVP